MRKAEENVMRYKCKICGAEAEHKVYQVKEMYFGTGEEFTYFECGQCQCMQIASIPDNLGDFYGNEYYSFSVQKIPKVAEDKINETRILDVGCGAGKWLLERYEEGHVNLFGCDPFIEQDIYYEPCIQIKKCTIHEMQGTFDLIRLGDSFEHMDDPLETLMSIKRLLSDDGMGIINMPLFPSAAYDVCGVSWYGWDAPRHLFLHSRKSMEYLCGKAGLKIEEVRCNSRDLQFISSLLYQKGIPYIDHTDEVINRHFTSEQRQQFAEYTTALNAKGYGDHAIFVLKK